MAADDDFIRQYEGFVRSIVTRTRRELGLEADPADLVAYGFQGLLEARERFEAALTRSEQEAATRKANAATRIGDDETG